MKQERLIGIITFGNPGKKIQVVRPDDIVCVEARTDHVNIKVRSRDGTKEETYTIHKSLKTVQETLDLIQIHRGWLINLYHLKAIDDEMAILNNGTQIPIGKSYKEELMKLLSIIGKG